MEKWVYLHPLQLGEVIAEAGSGIRRMLLRRILYQPTSGRLSHVTHAKGRQTKRAMAYIDASIWCFLTKLRDK